MTAIPGSQGNGCSTSAIRWICMALTFLTQNGTWVTMRSSLVPAPTERTCRSTPWSLETIARPRNRRGALRPHPSSDTATSVDHRRQTTMHTDPFILKLTGPAGGTHASDTTSSGNRIEVDAIDCCRILSGRGTRSASSTTHSSYSAPAQPPVRRLCQCPLTVDHSIQPRRRPRS